MKSNTAIPRHLAATAGVILDLADGCQNLLGIPKLLMNCNAKLVKHNMPRAKHNLQKAWPISGPEPEGTRHWLWAALAALQDLVPVPA